MRTLLSQFCEDFEGTVRPLLAPIERAIDALAASRLPASTARLLPEMRDVRHQLHTLVDKVAAQQAYVLIFGPLKSGKSTLMNAVSAAYVSEVSSLPAYPCMVYVSHADERQFVLTKYNGKTETFHDPAAMRLAVTRAHTDLARSLRETEQRGEEFDPARHFPEAIRRVDVKVPAGHLKESGAVLVDTPGLYSRMKFGYDRMTREFRDTAACAIFCVKSDNLFLEQVFEEFTDLLELFSRIFLVVNLDTGKKDLRPDGSLVPSLEHDDPIRIIEAFENLSMSAPLKQAAEEGRLRIYPVDLLRAASKRLTGEKKKESWETGQADFDTFLGDLTDYLNSTDYLVAFLGDSLRHADSLLTDARDLCETDSLKEMAERVKDLESEQARARIQSEVLSRLSGFAWSKCVDRFQESLLTETSDEVRAIKTKTANALKGALESWFETGASLKSLTEDHLLPLHQSAKRELENCLRSALSRRIGGTDAGLDLPTNLRNDLVSASLRLDALAREASAQIENDPGGALDPPQIDCSAIPVRRGFVDWVLFRSKARVAKSVFGPPSNPSRGVPKALKSRRLGAAARQHLWEEIEDHLNASMARRVKQLSRFVFGDYSEALQASLLESLEAKRKENTDQLVAIGKQLEEEGRILTRISDLSDEVQRTLSDVADLSDRYGETEPDLLIQPAPPRVQEPPKPTAAPSELQLEDTGD